MAKPLANALAIDLYPRLVKLALEKRVTTYGELASAVGRDPNREGLAVASALKSIHRWCEINSYPSIDAIVVSGDSGEVGDWLRERLNAEAERQKVFAFDWARVRGPALTAFGRN